MIQIVIHKRTFVAVFNLINKTPNNLSRELAAFEYNKDNPDKDDENDDDEVQNFKYFY